MRRAIVLFALAVLAGCGGDGGPPVSDDAASAKLSDIRTIADFRDAFEADDGIPRLVVILGPT